MGRQTGGVIGMRLAEDDEVIVLGVSSDGEEMIASRSRATGSARR
jgi:hypothetical protein